MAIHESSQPARTAPRLLTPDEVATILRKSGRTVRRYAANGLLPSIRVGPRSLRFDPIDVAGFLRDGRSESPSDGRTG